MNLNRYAILHEKPAGEGAAAGLRGRKRDEFAVLALYDGKSQKPGLPRGITDEIRRISRGVAREGSFAGEREAIAEVLKAAGAMERDGGAVITLSDCRVSCKIYGMALPPLEIAIEIDSGAATQSARVFADGIEAYSRKIPGGARDAVAGIREVLLFAAGQFV